MFSKTLNKIIFFTRTFALIAFLLMQFFGFGSATFASNIVDFEGSGCKFTITSMEAQPTTVTRTQTVRFFVSIKREGKFTQSCQDFKTVNISYRFNDKNIGSKEITSKDYDFATYAKDGVNFNVSDVTYDLSNYTDWNRLSTCNRLPYTINVNIVGYAASADTDDWGKALTVTGPGCGSIDSSIVPLEVSFNKPFVKVGEDLEVRVNPGTDATSKWPQGVNSADVLFYVGDVWTGVKISNLDKNAILNGSVRKIINVSTATKFTGGVLNTVRVDLQQPTSPFNVFGRGYGTIKIDSAVSGPNVILSPTKSSYSPNDQVSLLFSNMPSGWFGNYCVNIDKNSYSKCTRIAESANNSFSVILNESNGFNLSGQNNILIEIQGADGNSIKFANGNTLTFNIGVATGSTSTPGIITPPVNTYDCTTHTTSDPDYTKYCLYNPLPFNELTTTFLFIARGFLGIVAIWGVIFIIVGGFRMVMAQGDEEAYTKARKTVTWAVLGVVIAALSFSIIAIVQNLLGANVQK